MVLINPETWITVTTLNGKALRCQFKTATQKKIRAMLTKMAEKHLFAMVTDSKTTWESYTFPIWVQYLLHPNKQQSYCVEAHIVWDTLGVSVKPDDLPEEFWKTIEIVNSDN